MLARWCDPTRSRSATHRARAVQDPQRKHRSDQKSRKRAVPITPEEVQCVVIRTRGSIASCSPRARGASLVEMLTRHRMMNGCLTKPSLRRFLQVIRSLKGRLEEGARPPRCSCNAVEQHSRPVHTARNVRQGSRSTFRALAPYSPSLRSPEAPTQRRYAPTTGATSHHHADQNQQSDDESGPLGPGAASQKHDR